MASLSEIVIAGVPAVLAITLHEAAHGYAALALGDDTARRAGRLSLNPLRHVDRVGTIILPGLLLVVQLVFFSQVRFLFGWAKPVPVSAWRFKHPRRGMALVAAAGPAMNFSLAFLAALLLPRLDGPTKYQTDLYEFVRLTLLDQPLIGALLFAFIAFNLLLGLFNLLPIPPLDGGRIVIGILPASIASSWAKLERIGIVIVLVIVFIGPRALASVGVAFDPVHALLSDILPGALRLVLRLSGHQIADGGRHDFLL